jgi:hypothetical protein
MIGLIVTFTATCCSVVVKMLVAFEAVTTAAFLSQSGLVIRHAVISVHCSGTGVQWSTINKPVSVDDNFAMSYVFLMLIFDIFFYALITWYFDALLPGDFGTPQPFYFPFTVIHSFQCLLDKFIKNGS